MDTDLYLEAQNRLPSVSDRNYRDLDVDEWAMSLSHRSLKQVWMFATDDIPDSEERINEFARLVGAWMTEAASGYGFCRGTRFESSELCLIGDIYLKGIGDMGIARTYYVRAVQCGHKQDGSGALKALQRMRSDLGIEDPIAEAGY